MHKTVTPNCRTIFNKISRQTIKDFCANHCFHHGEKRKRRSRREESQSSDRDENTPETTLTQDIATLVDVSEIVHNIFDRNSCSEPTEPSETGNEIEVISQRLAEHQNVKD